MAVKESPSASIAADESLIAKAVLMPGDPLRAKYVADHYLEDPVCFNTVRNMLGYTGTYKGKKISVMGHGMGVPSVGIYSYELYQFFGVDTIIRIGSAGGIGDDVKVRDVVIAMGASTNSHFADQYRFPGQLCATADFGLLRTAVEEAERMGVRADVGQVFTADQFYNDNPEAGEMYRKFGILALEMEAAGLYWTAQRLGQEGPGHPHHLRPHLHRGGPERPGAAGLLPRDDGDRPGDRLEVSGGLRHGPVRKAGEDIRGLGGRPPLEGRQAGAEGCGHQDHGVGLLRHGDARLRLRRQAGPPGFRPQWQDRPPHLLPLRSSGGCGEGPGSAVGHLEKKSGKAHWPFPLLHCF